MKKRTIYLRKSGTAALLCFSLLTPLFFGLNADASERSMDGDGSAGSPYVIEDAADLMAFAEIVNSGNFDVSGILEADIILTADWTPIGGTGLSDAYTGTFTGNGHTVTFSSTTAGLFGCNSGTIRDVSAAGSISGTDYAGSVAQVNKGVITGCRNEASVSVVSPVSFAGGIAGVNIGTIENSANTGAISSSVSGSNIGGIAGAAREGTLLGCTNSGAITLNPDSHDPEYTEGCAGGITGLNYKAVIERSGNYGSVTSTDANGYTGGVTGLNNGSVINCANGSAITGSYYTGGIAGYNFLNEEAGTALIRNSLNHGSVTENETGYGAVCGVNSQGAVYDNYYLENTAAAGIGTSDNNGTTKKTAAALSGGEVTYQLNGNRSSNPSWYQTLGHDAFPVLDSAHKTVYMENKNGVITYSNDPSAHTDHEFGEDGKCEICDYESVSLYGHSLTLDGAIGLNYYYHIDPMYYADDSCTITASFTVGKRTSSDSFDLSRVLATGDPDTPQVYGFEIYLNSDEMTEDIHAKLEIEKDGKTIVVFSDKESFRGYDYLKKLYENKDNIYTDELTHLAQALATHDYYANEHFKYRGSYTPDIDLLSLHDVTADTVQDFAQSVEDQSRYPARHYALSMQFHSEHMLYLYISSEQSLNGNHLYMGYKTHGSSEDYTYTKAKKSGKYYLASTEKIPASQLDIMWDCAFFHKNEDGSYTQITSVKTAGPLSYVASSLKSGSTKESMRNLNKAVYLYYKATKNYFDSIPEE